MSDPGKCLWVRLSEGVLSLRLEPVYTLAVGIAGRTSEYAAGPGGKLPVGKRISI